MQKRIVVFLKKQWLGTWMVVSILILSVMFVSAEYLDELSSMNRVVVAVSEQKMMFSSNVLVSEGGLSFIPKYEAQLTAEQINNGYTYDELVKLWNYDRSNPMKAYPENITYDIMFKLVDTAGTALTAEQLNGRSIVILKGNEEVTTLNSTNLDYSHSSTLTYSSSGTSEDSYTVRFPGNWNFTADDGICVQIVATPNNGGNTERYADLTELGAIIGLKQLQSMGSSGWNVYLNESRISGDFSPPDCDAYNLVVTGSGAANITLKINTNYLTFNKYFYDSTLRVKNFTTGEVVYTEPDANGIVTILIRANSSTNRNTGADAATNPEYRNRYDIQLYKKLSETSASGAGDPADWTFFAEESGAAMPTGVWVTYSVGDAGN